MKTLSELQHYKYRGARALLILQEYGLRHFLESWKKAKEQNLALPETTNPNYQSLEYLLRHVLRTPQTNMTWICEKLGLPDPCINEPPDVLAIDKEAEWYLIYLLEKLREPLADVEPDQFKLAFESRWKVIYSIEGMLEHLVAHAFRHTLQIEELCAAQAEEKAENLKS